MILPEFAPDPLVTASVYCSGQLDRVIHQALGPTLRRLRDEEPGGKWLLWWIRYAKLGDHVKVRLHGPEGRKEEAVRALGESVKACLAQLPPTDGAEPRTRGREVPSIGPEDDAPESHPDRTLLWTGYRRSFVTFGPKRLLGDDAYIARSAQCLGRGADLLLKTTALDSEGVIPGSVRQRALIRALIAGLGATGFDDDTRRAYLSYHRDWLVRFWSTDPTRDAERLAEFEERLGTMPATVAQLRLAAKAQWAGASAMTGDEEVAGFRSAVAELWAHVEPLRRRWKDSDDPFTDDATFPVMFKAFHGLANQVGLSGPNEAFIHHLLLRVAEGERGPAPEPAAVKRDLALASGSMV